MHAVVGMHELALAQSLVELIEEEAERNSFTKIRKIWLDIGALVGIEPDALRFGFEVATRGGCAEGVEVEIHTPPGEAQCLGCQEMIEIQALYDSCPHCGGNRLRVTGGKQFKLKQMEGE